MLLLFFVLRVCSAYKYEAKQSTFFQAYYSRRMACLSPFQFHYLYFLQLSPPSKWYTGTGTAAYRAFKDDLECYQQNKWWWILLHWWFSQMLWLRKMSRINHNLLLCRNRFLITAKAPESSAFCSKTFHYSRKHLWNKRRNSINKWNR